jgi:hypothetical protein
MTSNGLLVVQRLSRYYQWKLGEIGKRVELFSDSDKRLVGFKSLNDLSKYDWQLMNSLSNQLSEVSIDNALLEINEQPFLFVQEYDSDVVLRLLKNMGVAIAADTNNN